MYQGHHGDSGANIADVVLPGAAYTETEGCYVNTEGRPQYGQVATQPPGDAREDWAILRALSAKRGLTLPYDSFSDLRVKMIQICPELGDPNIISKSEWCEFGLEGSLEDTTPYSSGVKNYFMTDPVSRASRTMLECTKQFLLTDPRPAPGAGDTPQPPQEATKHHMSPNPCTGEHSRINIAGSITRRNPQNDAISSCIFTTSMQGEKFHRL